MFTLMMMITESSNKLRVCHGQQKLKRRNWCMVIIMRPSLYFTADWLYTEICDFELCKNITRRVGFAEQTSVRATAYSRENYIIEQRGHARTREAKGQLKKKVYITLRSTLNRMYNIIIAISASSLNLFIMPKTLSLPSYFMNAWLGFEWNQRSKRLPSEGTTRE